MVNKLLKPKTNHTLPPSYNDVIKFPAKYSNTKNTSKEKSPPTYDEIIEYDYELEQTGNGKGLCKKCKKGVHKYWKKNSDGDIFHRFCFYN